MRIEADMEDVARQGCTVIVPFREEMTKRHLKVTGDLGRVNFIVRYSLCSPAPDACCSHQLGI